MSDKALITSCKRWWSTWGRKGISRWAVQWVNRLFSSHILYKSQYYVNMRYKKNWSLSYWERQIQTMFLAFKLSFHLSRSCNTNGKFSLFPCLFAKRAHLSLHFNWFTSLALGAWQRETRGTTRYCPASPPLFRLHTIVFPILGNA